MEQTIFEFGRIASREQALLAGLVGIALAAGVIHAYRRDAARRSLAVRIMLTSLRLGVLAIAAWIFLDPRYRIETTINRPSRAILLIDKSLSMTVRDQSNVAGTPLTRQEAVAAALEKSDLVGNLRAAHDIAAYGFGRELVPLDTLARRTDSEAAPATLDFARWMTATDDQTRLGDALLEAVRREQTHPLSGVIVLSDGRSTAGGPLEPAARLAARAKAPLHGVVIGKSEPPTNLHIGRLTAPARAFVGDEVKIAAPVSGVGLDNPQVEFELAFEPRGGGPATIIEKKSVSLPPDGTPVPLEFLYTPKQTGSLRLRLRTPNNPKETRADDNAAQASLDVVDEKTKVLLLAGGPSHEYRFLRNLLFRDKSMELTILLQSSIDLATQDASRVLRTAPETRDELFGFDVIVAIDTDWTAIAPPARQLIVEWVDARAGGLGLVAGPVHTPRLARDETLSEIAQLYPVRLKEVFSTDLEGRSPREPWPIKLTAEGMATDFLRLGETPDLTRSVWERFPGFFWCYPVTGVKPGANVLATYSDPRALVSGQPPPAIASQFFGAGRVVYLGSGEMWRLRRVGDKHHDQFWVKLVRHLGQGRLLRGAGRGSIIVDADDFPTGAPVRVEARILDEAFRPLAAGSAAMKVTGPGGKASELKLLAETGRPGRFSGTFTPRQGGEYQLELPVPRTTEVARRQITATVPELEFNDPRADRAALESLARATGGSVRTLDDIAAIPALLDDRSETIVLSSPPVSLWDRWWVMVLAAALLSAEWIIRKQNYLA